MTKAQEKQIENLKKKIDKFYKKMAIIRASLKRMEKRISNEKSYSLGLLNPIITMECQINLKQLYKSIRIPAKYEIVNALENDEND